MSPKPGRTGGLERWGGATSRSASSTLGQGPVGSPAGAMSHSEARCPAMYATGLRNTTVRTTTAANAMSFGVIGPSSCPGGEQVLFQEKPLDFPSVSDSARNTRGRDLPLVGTDFTQAGSGT